MAEKMNVNLLEVIKEIGIITFGILIAYQLNNWKDVRSTRNTEKKMLQEIKANLRLDLIDLNDNRQGHSQSLLLIDSIRSIAEGGVYSENIPLMIRMVLRDFVFSAQTSAFETLKAQGVNLIQNDTIRIRILRLYDFNYRTIEKIEESYQPHQFTKHYDHIVLNYFDGFDLRIENGATPINSGTGWLLSPDVKNRLDLVKAEHQFILQQYDKSISEVNALINTIENELKNEF